MNAPMPVKEETWAYIKTLFPFLWFDEAKLHTGEISPEIYVRHPLLIIRFLLFTLTSVFYLTGPIAAAIFFKMVVVITMLVATFLAQDLYASWDLQSVFPTSLRDEDKISTELSRRSKSASVLWLIFGETIGIALLILPTGGLDSPFVWYVLNPILAAAVFLPCLYSWITLILFLAAALGASMIYPGITGSIFSFFFKHWSLLLVFFMSTSLAQVAVSLYKRLISAYSKLSQAHSATEKYLKHISSLYQALEAFSSQEDRAQLAEVLALYANRICEAPAACFLKKCSEDDPAEDCASILRVSVSGDDRGINWETEMLRLWQVMKDKPARTEEGPLIVQAIMAHGECFGLLAFLKSPGLIAQKEESTVSLAFLAELGGIILGRLKAEQLWGRLLVSEEQNRIANEIHDGVSQYLFSIVCALHTLAREEAYLQDASIQKQLNLLEETAHRASRELRASIYQLSPHKRGESIFLDNLASYLDELGRLNSIQVDLQSEGSEEVLSPALRKGLYRIVREASSNAIRHGKCTSLQVNLSMAPGSTVLEIRDNGCGYEGIAEKYGLGIKNMYQLAGRFNGELQILGEPGRGTMVRCSFPKKTGERTGTEGGKA